jgi:transcriptional regulator with GAF, ATPase, and Fis domain
MWHQLFPWGTLAFVALLGYILEHRFSQTQIHLEQRTRDLDQANADLRDQIAERLKAAEALRQAYEELRQLKERLQEENLYLQEEIRLDHDFEEIITRSEALKQVLRKVEQVAATDSTVLVLGETGTGKELLARAVHKISPRRDRPLVKVNCAALPLGLVESELFGHEKGAFTGALARRIGRFELADGGTIFLDEIGDLPLELQVKLLRVLQEGEFERLGSPRTIRVDVRVIAATNRDLRDAMANGEFRQDLYYRLSAFPILLPPLRERREDIALLVQHFVQRYAARTGIEIRSVSPRVMEALAAYPWPGNVRELEHVVERGIITTGGPNLEPGDWLPRMEAPAPVAEQASLEELERQHIIKVLESTGWRVSGERGAATILGLKRTTLEARMRKLGIVRPG